MYKVGFIVNGKNRNKSRLFRDLKRVKDSICNLEYNFVETSWSGHATALATELAREGYTHLVAVGGDGTLHEVVNGALLTDNAPIVGLLPLGSANDFSRTVDIPKQLVDTFQSIIDDATQAIDVGKVELQGADQNRHQYFFINILDLGIGADVVKRVNRSSRIWGSGFIFYKAILQSFMTYKNQMLTCETESWTWSGKMNSFIVANAKYFGNGMCIAPQAEPNSGYFQIVLLGDISISDYIKQVGKTKKGMIIDHPQVEYREASKLKLTADQSCGIEADGEFLGSTPCEISILPARLNFIVSQA